MIDEEKEYEASGRKVKVEVNGGSLDTGTDSTGGDNGAVMYDETEYEAGGRNVKVEVDGGSLDTGTDFTGDANGAAPTRLQFERRW